MLVEIEAGKKDVEGHMAEIVAREKAVEDGLLAYCFGVDAEKEAMQRRKPCSKSRDSSPVTLLHHQASSIKVNVSGTHIWWCASGNYLSD